MLFVGTRPSDENIVKVFPDFAVLVKVDLHGDLVSILIGHESDAFHTKALYLGLLILRSFAVYAAQDDASRHLIDFKYSFASFASGLSGARAMTFSRSGFASFVLRIWINASPR